MIEVYPKLWVGSKDDHSAALEGGMHIVHATKSCHLVDAVFSPCRALIEAAIGWLTTKHWLMGEPVLIHCNQGYSRAPSLALLYLHRRMEESWETFAGKYPPFAPGSGMVEMLDAYGVSR